MNKIFQQPALNEVKKLLDSFNLPSSDLNNAHLVHFFGCGSKTNLKGVIGAEIYETDALVRSLAVIPELQGQGCGSSLYEKLEQHCKDAGLTTLYLLTETAESFFFKKGFTPIDKSEASEAIRKTREFSSLCPDSAVLMRKKI